MATTARVGYTQKESICDVLAEISALRRERITYAEAAHDLNNQLTAIMGFLHLAKTTKNFDEIEPQLSMVTEKCVNSTRLILDTARRQNHPTYQHIYFSLQYFNSLVGFLSAALDRRITTRGYYNASGLSIRGDPWQIKQILLNLVKNAQEAIPPDIIASYQGKIDIKYSSKEINARKYVVLSVKDNGVGFDSGKVGTAIFDLFYTTKQNGAGIGLYQSLARAKEHGGYLAAESEPGQWATFSLYLPVSIGREEVC